MKNNPILYEHDYEKYNIVLEWLHTRMDTDVVNV